MGVCRVSCVCACVWVWVGGCGWVDVWVVVGIDRFMACHNVGPWESTQGRHRCGFMCVVPNMHVNTPRPAPSAVGRATRANPNRPNQSRPERAKDSIKTHLPDSRSFRLSEEGRSLSMLLVVVGPPSGAFTSSSWCPKAAIMLPRVGWGLSIRPYV